MFWTLRSLVKNSMSSKEVWETLKNITAVVLPGLQKRTYAEVSRVHLDLRVDVCVVREEITEADRSFLCSQSAPLSEQDAIVVESLYARRGACKHS